MDEMSEIGTGKGSRTEPSPLCKGSESEGRGVWEAGDGVSFR